MQTWETEIRECETAACRAFLSVDKKALDALWADNFAVNSPLHRVLLRKDVIGLLEAGRIRHTTYEFEIEHMFRSGDVVVVMGNDRVTNPPDDSVVRRRFTNVWQLESGSWRCIARHANAIPTAGPG